MKHAQNKIVKIAKQWIVSTLCFIIRHTAKVNHKLIVLHSSPDFSDNAKALYDYMIANGYDKDFDIYFAVEHLSRCESLWGDKALTTKQLLRELSYYRRLFFIAHPAVSLPFFSPAQLKRVANILRIAVKLNLARLFKRLKTFDNRGKLHTVVGRNFFSARKLLFNSVISQNRAPATRTGISAASAVGKYLYSFQNRNSFFSLSNLYFATNGG